MSFEDYDDYEEAFFGNEPEPQEDEFDAMSEQSYELAFEEERAHRQGDFQTEELEELHKQQQEFSEDDFEFDSVVGGRDKKPVMSLLNKGRLSKYEMDDLLNELGE